MQTSDFKLNNDKKPCSTCGKKHAGACNFKEKVVAAGGRHKNNQQAKPKGNQNAGSGGKSNKKKRKICLICKGAPHILPGVKHRKTGDDIISKKLIDCPRWMKADKDQKKEIIDEIQKETTIC